ncbi:MAG: universal stress protein [Flavobacteriales bacterium]
MSKKKILVPTDFTKAGRCAEGHAIRTAEIVDGEVYFLHIVGDKEELEGAREKLEKEVEERNKDHNVEIHPMVRVGSIFEDIGDAAAEVEAELIFMGTHGMKGMQYLKGSNAMRVIKHSSVPFIVVQEKPIDEKGYDDIVVPLDLSKETKQKLDITVNLAKYFDSRIHLITPQETDEFLKNQLERNLHFAEDFFKENGVEYTTKSVDEKASNFVRTIIRHASEKNADLITIVNLQENSLLGAFASSEEQKLITNEAQVPVMVINPHQTTDPSSVTFSTEGG